MPFCQNWQVASSASKAAWAFSSLPYNRAPVRCSPFSTLWPVTVEATHSVLSPSNSTKTRILTQSRAHHSRGADDESAEEQLDTLSNPCECKNSNTIKLTPVVLDTGHLASSIVSQHLGAVASRHRDPPPATFGATNSAFLLHRLLQPFVTCN